MRIDPRLTKLGRAQTNAEKEAVARRILNVWLSRPTLRLGQLLDLALCGEDLFYCEDQRLAEYVEKLAEEYVP